MKKIITILIILALIITSGVFLTYQWYSNQVYTENLSNETIEFEVKDGDNLLGLAPKLAEAGLISNVEVLKIYVRLNDVSANIKAGKYVIQKGHSLPNLIKLLVTGTFNESILFTIKEGQRYEEFAEELEGAFNETSNSTVIFSKQEFLNIVASPDDFVFSNDVSTLLIKYKPEGKSLRGLLFPDTYRFDYNLTAKTVIETLLRNFDKRLLENGITLDNLNKNQTTLKSIYEVVTLASIIEKEAGRDADRPIVSGIFHNRLSTNYPLQSDITLHFIKNDGDTFISFADTRIDSPYNTYKNAGLTPTPINNPGMSSIKAALNPQESDYFFFIYDEEGNFYYAVTYAEHIENVRKHL